MRRAGSRTQFRATMRQVSCDPRRGHEERTPSREVVEHAQFEQDFRVSSGLNMSRESSHQEQQKTSFSSCVASQV